MPSTITVGSAVGRGHKELRRDYPIVEGLTAGTTKQEGTVKNLVPEISSVVNEKDKI